MREKIIKIWGWVKNKVKYLLVILGMIGVTTTATLLGGLPKNDISQAKLQAKYKQAATIKKNYTLSNSSLKKIVKADPRDRIKMTIGNDVPVSAKGLVGGTTITTDFAPTVKIERWDEVSMTLTPMGLDKIATKDKTLSFNGDKIEFGTPKINYEFYDMGISASNSEGAFEYNVILKERPASNVIQFQLDTQGLDFFYQPPLWQEQGLKEPTKDCTDTDCKGSHRPIDVVGSYAVYASENKTNYVGGKEYKTGKVGHIFRPKLIDAVGKECWGELNIKDGILTITMPQDFLDKAVYPIDPDLTFGYTGTGGSMNNYISSIQVAWGPFVPAQSGNATSVSFYSWEVYGGNHTYGFWIDNGSDYPGIRQGDTDGFDMAKGWNTRNLDSPVAITGNQAYFIGLNSSNGYYYAYDSGITGQHYYYESETYVVGVLTNPYTAGAGDITDWRISIYATYTTGGGTASPRRRIIEE